MKFRMYDGTGYGFCETCKKTAIPTTVECSNGTYELLCPSCADREFDLADEELPNVCSFHKCDRPAVKLCRVCQDAICTFHERRNSLCELCLPESSYRSGWSAATGPFLDY